MPKLIRLGQAINFMELIFFLLDFLCIQMIQSCFWCPER
jgi:hypothetical protein